MAGARRLRDAAEDGAVPAVARAQRRGSRRRAGAGSGAGHRAHAAWVAHRQAAPAHRRVAPREPGFAVKVVQDPSVAWVVDRWCGDADVRAGELAFGFLRIPLDYAVSHRPGTRFG